MHVPQPQKQSFGINTQTTMETVIYEGPKEAHPKYFWGTLFGQMTTKVGRVGIIYPLSQWIHLKTEFS